MDRLILMLLPNCSNRMMVRAFRLDVFPDLRSCFYTLVVLVLLTPLAILPYFHASRRMGMNRDAQGHNGSGATLPVVPPESLSFLHVALMLPLLPDHFKFACWQLSNQL